MTECPIGRSDFPHNFVKGKCKMCGQDELKEKQECNYHHDIGLHDRFVKLKNELKQAVLAENKRVLSHYAEISEAIKK